MSDTFARVYPYADIDIVLITQTHGKERILSKSTRGAEGKKKRAENEGHTNLIRKKREPFQLGRWGPTDGVASTIGRFPSRVLDIIREGVKYKNTVRTV